MNPFVSIYHDVKVTQKQIVSNEHTLDVKKYSAIVQGFTSFEDAQILNNLARKLNVPFYCLNSSGLFGFYFADVGPELDFTHFNKSKDLEELHKITTSQNLSTYLSVFYSTKHTLNWNKRSMKKPHKFLFLSVLAQSMREQEPDINESELLTKIIQLVKEKGLPENYGENQEFRDIFDRLNKCFNLEFNPSSSVIGALVS